MSTILSPKTNTRWLNSGSPNGHVLLPWRARPVPVGIADERRKPGVGVSSLPILTSETQAPLTTSHRRRNQRARSPVLRLDAFLAIAYPPLRWRIDRLLPADGFSVLLGREKAGKSFFGQQQALCIAAGVPFLGQDTERARVLLIEEEGSKRMMQDRIKRQAEGLGIDTDGLELYPLVKERLRLETDGDQQYLRSVIVEYRPQVVIMGPLAQLFSLDDENAAAEMSKVTRFMSDLAAETDSVIQLAHHMNKAVNVNGARSQFFNGARGSSALIGAVDASIGLGRQEGQEKGRIHLLLRDDEGWSFNVRWDGGSVLFVRDNGAVAVDSTSTANESMQHGEDAICLSLLDYLADNPWKSCGGIAAETGIAAKNTVRSHLEGMVPAQVRRDTSTRSDLYAIAGETSEPPTMHHL